MFGVPLSEVVWLALLIAIAGAVVGIFAGLFGIGGGAVIVPVLYEVFRVLGVPEDLRMQMCIGTSLAIIVPTTVRSFLAHKARGAVISEVVRIWSLPAILGVVIGAVTAAYAPSAVFKVAFVVFASLISARMFLGTERWKLGDDLPGRGWQTLFGFITGLFSSLVGVSGGAVSNAILTFYGRTMQQAVATSSGVGVPITIAGAIGYMIAGWKYMPSLPALSIGFVSLIGFIFMAPVSSFTASYGVRLAHWLPKRKLEIAFACFLALASVRFLISLF